MMSKSQSSLPADRYNEILDGSDYTEQELSSMSRDQIVVFAGLLEIRLSDMKKKSRKLINELNAKYPDIHKHPLRRILYDRSEGDIITILDIEYCYGVLNAFCDYTEGDLYTSNSEFIKGDPIGDMFGFLEALTKIPEKERVR